MAMIVLYVIPVAVVVIIKKMQLLPLLYWCTQCYSHKKWLLPYHTQEMNGTMLDTFFFQIEKISTSKFQK